MAITPIGTPGTSAPALPASRRPDSGSPPFAEALSRLVDQVEQTGAGANDAVARMLDGTGDVHDAMIALQRADTTFQLAMQIRNKLVQAYQEIMRMPV